jgi:hypothetical protein
MSTKNGLINAGPVDMVAPVHPFTRDIPHYLYINVHPTIWLSNTVLTFPPTKTYLWSKTYE